MKTLKKIYYVPGMFSAILIPLLFWYLGNQKLKNTFSNVIDLEIVPTLHQPYDFETLKNWDYKRIVVQKNLAKKKSNYYVSEIQNLQKRNIKKTGIEFVLNKNSSYGDFVSIINDFAISKHPYYAIDLDKTGNVFAITDYNDSFKTEQINMHGLYLKDVITDNFIVKDNLKGFSKIKYIISQLPKETFYIIFGYLILLNMSVLSLLKKSI